MMHDFREIAPTFVLFAPRLWESIAADVRAGVMDSSPLKQKLFDVGMKTGLSALAHGKRSMFADQLLFRALRDRLGFTRLRSAATGGAALGPDTFKFFRAIGVPLRTLYGQTELFRAYTLHPSPRSIRIPPACRWQPISRSASTTPMSTASAKSSSVIPTCISALQESGSLGRRHERRLDAFGDAGIPTPTAARRHRPHQGSRQTSRGERFSPQYLENKLKFSLHRRDCVLGAGRDTLAAIICIRYSIISKWAEKIASRSPPIPTLLASRGLCAAAQGGQHQRHAAVGAADLPSAALQGTRRRRRRADPHPKGPPQRHQREYTDIIDAIYGGKSNIRRHHDHFQDGTTQRTWSAHCMAWSRCRSC